MSEHSKYQSKLQKWGGGGGLKHKVECLLLISNPLVSKPIIKNLYFLGHMYNKKTVSFNKK